MKTERAPTRRLHSLDGIRGLAAFSVLLSHAFWATPQFSDAVQRAQTGTADFFTYLMTYTPLHLTWLAVEPVLLFFVLSGFVVALPFLSGDRGYRAYYPARLVRLLLPAWAALLIAWVIVATIYPQDGSARSWLLNLEIGHDTSIAAFTHVLLITGTPDILPPLWSLQWELAFSLLLPVYVWVALRVNTLLRAVFVILACVAAYAAGTFFEISALSYLPLFLIGTVLAVNLHRIEVLLTPTRAGILAVVSALALSAQWYPRGLTDSIVLIGVGQCLAVLGATGLVVAAITCRPFARVLSEWRVLQWLGSRSFSLYLIHFPIIMAAAFLTNGENLAITLLVGTPLSLLAAEAFFRIVESPATKLARRIRTGLERQPAATPSAQRTIEAR